MALFSGFGGTRTVDQFILHHGRSMIDAQKRIIKDTTKAQVGNSTARAAIEQKVAQINADLAAANIESLSVGFSDQQGNALGLRVSGRSVASKTAMLAVDDSALESIGLSATGRTAYHKKINIGSEQHKALLKMLKRERIGRSGLRQARRSTDFIFMGPQVLNNVTQGNVYQTKVAFHEIGHSFSQLSGLHDEKNRASARIKHLISNIRENSTGRLEELFESASGVDDMGSPYSIPSRLDELKTAHMNAMTQYALEESRAEGFSHQMLGRTSSSAGTGTLLDEYLGFMKSSVKNEFIERAKGGEVLSADDMPGRLLERTLGYSKLQSFNTYEKRTTDPLLKAIQEKYGEEAIDDPRIKSFLRNLSVEGRTQAQKTVLESTDSPLVSRIQGGIESLIGKNIDDMTTKIGTKETDYYAREMGELLGRLPINRSGELAAHAAMTTESILPSLADDASGAASAVLRSAQSGGAELIGEIAGTIRPVSITKVGPAAGRAVTTASRVPTSSRIISGMQSAMRVAGIVK